MTQLISEAAIRAVNKELLNTDGISSDTIDNNSLNAQIEAFAMVAHLYDIDEINSSNLPSELELAIKRLAAGQTIIDEYPNDDNIVKIGMSYRSSATELLKNIISGKRKLVNLDKADIQATVTRSIVAKNSAIDMAVNTFIDSIQNWGLD